VLLRAADRGDRNVALDAVRNWPEHQVASQLVFAFSECS